MGVFPFFPFHSPSHCGKETHVTIRHRKSRRETDCGAPDPNSYKGKATFSVGSEIIHSFMIDLDSIFQIAAVCVNLHMHVSFSSPSPITTALEPRLDSHGRSRLAQFDSNSRFSVAAATLQSPTFRAGQMLNLFHAFLYELGYSTNILGQC
jgi:hypothetical protein